jgi:hypothetical protein
MGKRLHPDNFVKRKLKPILQQLGLEGAMHAFRHGNATALDGLNVPLKVRQERLAPKELVHIGSALVLTDARRISCVVVL